MKDRIIAVSSLVLGLSLSCAGPDPDTPLPLGTQQDGLGAPSGAIFTTLVDGSRVNANIYDNKDDVYLDGGPGPNAPLDAAGLDDGTYVFQVTDPSAQDLLSSDAARCRVVLVSGGVITRRLDWDGSGTTASDFSAHLNGNDACHRSGRHQQGTDIDHGPPAITVQLMPYDDTPNPGGVYKAWMVTLEGFIAGCAQLGVTGNSALTATDCGYAPGNHHGFLGADSKTDNFKVKNRGGRPQPTITVHKFCDLDCDGVQDDGNEGCLSGVAITVTDSSSATVCSGFTSGGYFDCQLPATGTYTVTEDPGAGMDVCGATVNGVAAGATTSVSVTVSDARVPALVSFGNTPTDGSISVSKTCAVGSRGGIDGFSFSLTGTDVFGLSVSASGTTSNGGSLSFGDLAAGTYTVTETVPAGWAVIGPDSCSVNLSIDTSLDSNGEPACTVPPASCSFENVALGFVGARTPGFWCQQVQREAGAPGQEAACFDRLICAFGTIDAIADAALASFGGDDSLFDLNGDGDMSPAEEQQILCPESGDAEANQCRRQALALLMNLAGHLGQDDAPECGAACSLIGVSSSQPIVIDGQLGTVGGIIDALESGGCSDELHALIKGINENTNTVLAECPASL